jgi:hypothetical protein
MDEKDKNMDLKQFQEIKNSYKSLEFLKDFGVEFVDGDPLEGIKLRHSSEYTSKGCEIIGEATNDELSIFAAFYSSKKKLDKVKRSVEASFFRNMGDYVESTDTEDRSIEDIQQEVFDKSAENITEEHREKMSFESRLNNLLKQLLYLKIGQRLSSCDAVMVITSDRKIVDIGDYIP